MTKIDTYRQTLKMLEDWDTFLLKESGLPGPRANLELVQAVADEGNLALFQRYLMLGPEQAPANSPQVFLPVCGIVGLGRLLAEGQIEHLETLRRYATDPRWRIREGVSMALQRLGDRDMAQLIAAVKPWSQGTPLEQRAAAAALCEPRLLRVAEHARAVLHILDEITGLLVIIEDRKNDPFQTLRKGLGYCWSVAVAALPEAGKPLMEKWLVSGDKDIEWIMRENLKKNRLARMDAPWVEKWQAQLT
jgi:hypothetical protein